MYQWCCKISKKINTPKINETADKPVVGVVKQTITKAVVQNTERRSSNRNVLVSKLRSLCHKWAVLISSPLSRKTTSTVCARKLHTGKKRDWSDWFSQSLMLINVLYVFPKWSKSQGESMKPNVVKQNKKNAGSFPSPRFFFRVKFSSTINCERSDINDETLNPYLRFLPKWGYIQDCIKVHRWSVRKVIYAQRLRSWHFSPGGPTMGSQGSDMEMWVKSKTCYVAVLT